jgi:hypothetical protein
LPFDSSRRPGCGGCDIRFSGGLDAGACAGTSTMTARLRAFLAIVSRFMGRLWLTVLYFTVVLPFGIVARVRTANRPVTEVAWNTREERAGDLADARKQF